MERVEVFKYLGRRLSMTDNDAPAVCAQLVKALRVWARVSAVLQGDNDSPKVCGTFYRSIVQIVLLYGSKSWVLSPGLLARLEGFHVHAAWRMAQVHKPQRGADRVWTYPPSANVLEEVGLHTMEEYI